MAPSSTVGCLGGVAAVTAAAAGLLEIAGRGLLSILERRAVKCLDCGKMKQPESIQKHADKHRARDAERTEQERAALKAEFDRRLAEQLRERDEQMRKEREDMRKHLIAVLEYKAHCDKDWFEQAKEERKVIQARELEQAQEDRPRRKGRRERNY
ncbi:hypothetical protein ZWY2020_053489 [Hordeum vulgare]|nr:hypothetical protein ZWY2020_053489 [Hordeum vulgare]